MKQYVCMICGFVYDEAAGMPDQGIAPGTRFEDLPETWTCPICGAPKSEFRLVGGEEKAAPADKPAETSPEGEDYLELSPLMVSALCSNLAKGCEKQYRAEEAKLFTELAGYFKAKAAPGDKAGAEALIKLVDQDLNSGFAFANAEAKEAGDRGALRALTWSEKVTRILKSLLARYEKEGEGMIENTSVFVCTICGFVYIGDTPPELCPVCKVPGWKFEKVNGR